MPNHPYEDNHREAQYNGAPQSPWGDQFGGPRNPYGGSGRRYVNSFWPGDQQFQFPWWAILLGFVVWWPLGFVFIAVNTVLRNQEQGKNHGKTARAPEQAPVYAAPEQAAQGAQTAPGAQAAPGAAKATAAPHRAAPQTAELQKQGARRAAVLLAAGVVLAVVGGVASISTFGEIASNLAYGIGIGWLLQDLITGLGFAVAGVGMCFAAQHMRTSLHMRKKIANIVGKSDHMFIEDIAGAIPCSYEKCCKHLESCIAKGIFGENAYLDMRTRSLVVRGAAPEPPKATEPQPAPKAAPKTAENDPYRAILGELHELNDRIPGEEMSDKISRLEKVAAKIFEQAASNPNKLPQMRKFMDYYLPTALKLLKTYAELDAQGIEGENITDSKARIEQAMDTLVVAFEKQLDQLFQSDALDVSTDIDVMENMLQADGLTQDADPFDLHK